MMLDLYKDTPALEEVVNQTGYKTSQSLMFLHHLVKNIAPEFVLELGTGLGCSTIFMALADKGKIISVDDYRGDMTTTLATPLSNIYKCNVASRIELIKADVRFPNWVEGNPGIVFMDASHNKVDLLSEYSAIEPILSKDHIIVIDDLFSTDVKEFAVVLLKKDCYDICFMPKFHNGMAVLSPYKFQKEILDAITKGAGYA